MGILDEHSSLVESKEELQRKLDKAMGFLRAREFDHDGYCNECVGLCEHKEGCELDKFLKEQLQDEVLENVLIVWNKEQGK